MESVKGCVAARALTMSGSAPGAPASIAAIAAVSIALPSWSAVRGLPS